jgi:hypothetical protein
MVFWIITPCSLVGGDFLPDHMVPQPGRPQKKPNSLTKLNMTTIFNTIYDDKREVSQYPYYIILKFPLKECLDKCNHPVHV